MAIFVTESHSFKVHVVPFGVRFHDIDDAYMHSVTVAQSELDVARI